MKQAIVTLPDQLKGRSLTTKVIPTVANLKNMLSNLAELQWDESKLKQWDKRSFKAYHIEQIKGMLREADKEKQKQIIREHILKLTGNELGASVVDIYIVAYVNQMYGEGKTALAKWLKEQQLTENSNSVGAIWQVGKGDGCYLGILNNDGSIKDWNFIMQWIG